MQNARKAVAGGGPAYTPLPLVFPPVDPPPGCSLSSVVLQQQGLEHLASTAAAGAAALSVTREHLLQRIQHLYAMHRELAGTQQPTACQQRMQRLLWSPEITHESAGTLTVKEGESPFREPTSAIAGATGLPTTLGATVADTASTALSENRHMFLGVAREGVSRLPASGSLSEGDSIMQRHAFALSMAEVYEAQLRLWHSFASQVQLQMLLHAHERATVSFLPASDSANHWEMPSGLVGRNSSGTIGAATAPPTGCSRSNSGGGGFANGVNAPHQALEHQQPAASAGSAFPNAEGAPGGAATAAPTPADSPASAATAGQEQPQHPQQQQQQRAPAWRLRFLVMYMKLLVLLFLFDAGKWIYMLCMLVALLHTNGAFNPVLDLIISTSHRQPFEATLAQLRRRRERRPLQRLRQQQQRLHASVARPTEGTPPSRGQASLEGSDNVLSHSSSSSDSSSSTSNSGSSSESSINSDNASRVTSMHGGIQEPHERRSLSPVGAPATASPLGLPEGPDGSPPAAPSGPPSSEGASAAASAQGPLSAASQSVVGAQGSSIPPYWKRALYQGVAMFVLTTIPWWNPDPALLVDYEGMQEEGEPESLS